MAGEPIPSTSQPTESAYDAVSLRELWGLLSLAAFACAVLSRWVVRLLPWEWQRWDRIPPTAVLIVPIFSILGLVLALLAGRKETVTGRVGFLINAVVTAISALLLVLILTWRLTR